MSTSPAAAVTEELPRWDLSDLYPGFDSDEYRSDFARLGQLLDELQAHFDAHSIRRMPPGSLGDERALEALLVNTLERISEIALVEDTLVAFTHAVYTTDSYDAAAARETSRLELLSTRRQQLDVRLKGFLGSIPAATLTALTALPSLAGDAYFLRDAARQSRYLMDEPLEELAAELVLDAGTAFGRLQGTVTSQLKVPFEHDGKTELLPIAMVRNLSFDPDREVRRRAYEVEQQGWHSIRCTVAACLNGVKGTALTLAKRRGRESVLQAALESNKVDQATLDALMGSIERAFPVFRRYLLAKAAKLGTPHLAWWDLFAPLGEAKRRFSWNEAREFIVSNFRTFSDDMGDFAKLAFERRWIDAGPRDGKRGGAYCMPVMAKDQSRILANFDGSFDQVSTLAHELGHGYHNHCQNKLPVLRRGSPSTLAETASIFCETLVAEAALQDATPDQQLMILEAQLSGATQVCLDISSRFRFESAVFARRAAGELSPDELCELMLQAQRETYAEAIDESTYHRYMWLWKPHYYAHTENFYNFPYAFGHLFGLGLYAIYCREGAPFVSRYRDLLRGSGRDEAAPLAAQFGLDIRSPGFWEESLAVIADQVTRFEGLVR